MSSQIPPDPITNNYNPSAWAIPELTEEETIALDKAYIKFPIAQNQPITFPATVSGQTASNTENSAIVATTAFVNNFFTYIRTLAWTWSGFQSFTGGINANSIGPTAAGGTITIGNYVSSNVNIAVQASRGAVLHLGDGASSSGGIHIGNGNNATNNVNILNGTGSTGTINLGSATSTTNLNCFLTPTYAYPVTSGKIGYMNTVITATKAIVPGNTDIGQNLVEISLVAGVYILTGWVTIPDSANTIKLGITLNSSLTFSTSRGNNFAVQGTGTTGTNSTNVIISISSTQTWCLMGQTLTTGNWTNATITATRIA